MRTYGKLEYGTHKETGEVKWVIQAAEPHVLGRLKKIFPRIPEYEQPPLYFHDQPEVAADLEWFLARYPMEMSDIDKKKLKGNAAFFRKTITETEQIFKPEFKFPAIIDMKKPAYDYQLVAAELYDRVKRYLLGDPIGLGKTIEAIASMLRLQRFPAAVVVQAHLGKQWKDKIEEFSHLRVHIIKGRTPYELPEADVYIFKYSNVAGWVDYFTQLSFKQVIFDEIQELRIEGTAKYESSKQLADKAEAVLAMSGTPIYNYADELWNIYNVVKPDALGTKRDFEREWAFGGSKKVKNPKELGAFLRENHLFLRRTRAEVGRELPPVNKIIHTVPYDEEAVEKELDLAAKLAESILYGSKEEAFTAAGQLDLRMRKITGISKAKYVAEYVRMLVEAGEKVLLAGWHRQVYEIWQTEFNRQNVDGKTEPIRWVMYTGEETANQKNKSKEAFIKGEADVMMISLRSGVGLDGLQGHCKVVVLGELDWSPQVHKQVIGRIHRDGMDETENVTAIFLVSDGGSDPVLVELLGEKASQQDSIVDPFAGVEETHVDYDRVKMLAEMVLARRKKKK